MSGNANPDITRDGVASAVQDKVRGSQVGEYVEVFGVDDRYRVVWTAETNEVRVFEMADVSLWVPTDQDVLVFTLEV